MTQIKEAFKDKTGETYLGGLEGARKRGRLYDDEPPKSKYDAEFLDRCREIGIDERTIRDDGDYRQLGEGKQKKIYWLPLPELLDFETADAEIVDDDEFWEWFENFAETRALKTKQERTRRETKRWDNWSSGFEWKPQKLGQWWSGWGYDSNAGGSELSKRLAVALKAINTTVGVVNTSGKRYRVKLASQDTREQPQSFTSYDEHLIVVSPQALLDTTIEQDTGIEVTTGYGLHEASHADLSESLLEHLRQPTILRPQSVAALLHNILEDIRIEQITAAKFPGFAEYFATALTYLWGVGKAHAPTTWGPELQDKMNAAICMSKWPVEYEPIAMNDPALAKEFTWWREWVDNYVTSKEPIRQSLIRALEHLGEDPQTQQQMDQLTTQEENLEKQTGKPMDDNAFRELLKKLEKMLADGKAIIETCPSPDQPQGGGIPRAGAKTDTTIELTAEQSAELEKLLEEDYQQHEAFYKMKDGERNVSPLIEVSRPIENHWSKEYYRSPGGMVERLRSVFYFRKKRTTEYERLLKSGAVDEEELWRAGTGDTRVFERATQPEETFTSVTMLVDASGSMSGEGLEKAQELAHVMMACLRTQRGVRTRVRAHSTGAVPGHGQTCRVYRIWDPGDPDTRLGILQGAISHNSNFDGFAIDWCAKELFDGALPGETLLLIVLSDGLPAGTITDDRGSVHYGGANAMDHMKMVSENWGRQGVTIVQIAIDQDGIRPEDQARMFKHWIGYETDGRLLTDLTRLLEKTFGAIE